MATQLQNILDELLMLVSESEEYHGMGGGPHQAFHEILADVRRTLAEDILDRADKLSGRYVVAVVGLTNVGKSTLLNALFGHDLAPRRNGPCTAAPIEFICDEFAYQDRYRVSVHYFGSFQQSVWEYPDIESVHKRLEALVDNSGAKQSRTIQRVVVHTKLPLLENGLVIADTPGFGAAQLEGAEGSHETSLKTYLSKSVSQVLWVILGEQGVLKAEKEFYDQFFGKLCDDIIVTGCDDWEQKDKDRFRHRFSQVFEHRLPTFHFASGKLGGQARKSGSIEDLEQAGIPLIEERIKSLADVRGRTAGIETTVLELAKDLRSWYWEFCIANDGRRISFWRPDSFDRFSVVHPEYPFQRQLVEVLTFEEKTESS